MSTIETDVYLQIARQRSYGFAGVLRKATWRRPSVIEPETVLVKLHIVIPSAAFEPLPHPESASAITAATAAADIDFMAFRPANMQRPLIPRPRARLRPRHSRHSTHTDIHPGWWQITAASCLRPLHANVAKSGANNPGSPASHHAGETSQAIVSPRWRQA